MYMYINYIHQILNSNCTNVMKSENLYIRKLKLSVLKNKIIYRGKIKFYAMNILSYLITLKCHMWNIVGLVIID